MIDPDVWKRAPRPDAIRYEIVYDDDLGCIAEATLPTGETFYGVDTPPTRGNALYLPL